MFGYEYEYVPARKRGRETALAGAFSVVAVALYALPTAAKLPYPALFQLSAVACFAAAILIAAKHLLRSYRYRVAPSANGAEPELTVTEEYGKRRTVVCRIALADILRAERIESPDAARGAYRYVSGFRRPDLCLIEADDGEDRPPLRVLICADETLLRILAPTDRQTPPEA